MPLHSMPLPMPAHMSVHMSAHMRCMHVYTLVRSLAGDICKHFVQRWNHARRRRHLATTSGKANEYPVVICHPKAPHAYQHQHTCIQPPTHIHTATNTHSYIQSPAHIHTYIHTPTHMHTYSPAYRCTYEAHDHAAMAVQCWDHAADRSLGDRGKGLPRVRCRRFVGHRNHVYDVYTCELTVYVPEPCNAQQACTTQRSVCATCMCQQ